MPVRCLSLILQYLFWITFLFLSPGWIIMIINGYHSPTHLQTFFAQTFFPYRNIAVAAFRWRWKLRTFPTRAKKLFLPRLQWQVGEGFEIFLRRYSESPALRARDHCSYSKNRTPCGKVRKYMLFVNGDMKVKWCSGWADWDERLVQKQRQR